MLKEAKKEQDVDDGTVVDLVYRGQAVPWVRQEKEEVATVWNRHNEELRGGPPVSYTLTVFLKKP